MDDSAEDCRRTQNAVERISRTSGNPDSVSTYERLPACLQTSGCRNGHFRAGDAEVGVVERTSEASWLWERR